MKKCKFILSILISGSFLIGCSSEEKPHQEHEHDHDHDHSKMEMTPKDAELTNESIYQLNNEWQDQNDNSFQLKQLEGKTPLIAMVFTHCDYACPRIVGDMKAIEEQIPQNKKKDFAYVLVSFDTERDTPERLREFAKEMQLDDQWILLHGNDKAVRELSMVLNVSYKKQDDGNFAHSNQITLLNTKGEIVSQVEGLGTDPAPILNKIEAI